MRFYRNATAALVLLVAPIMPSMSGDANAAVSGPRQVSIGDVRIAEGDSGKTVVRLTVGLDYRAPADIPITYRVFGGSATANSDFVSTRTGVKNGKLTILANRVEAFISITIKGDANPEGDETIFIDLLSAGNESIMRARGTVAILDDDTASSGFALAARSARSSGGPRVAVGTPTISEGDSGIRHAIVPVALSVPAPAPITVAFTTPGTVGALTGDSCNDLNAGTVSATTINITFNTGQQSKFASIAVRSNTDVGQALLDVLASIQVTNGNATIADPASSIEILEDDTITNSVGTPPSVGTARISELVDGTNPTFPTDVANTSNGCGYPSSTGAAMSADGHYVAFTSNANNLVGDDTNGYNDVFVKNTWNGDVELISRAVDGGPGNQASYAESISGDGRYVSFSSSASDLVVGDTNSWRDSFVYDRVSGSMRRLGADVATFHGGSSFSNLSGDGRYVVYSASLPGICASCAAVYVLDQTSNVATAVSQAGGIPLLWGNFANISRDGSTVAFLGPNGTGGMHLYVKDLATGALTIESRNNAGELADDGLYGMYPTTPAMSADGSMVAWVGNHCNLGVSSTHCGGTGSHIEEVYVRNRTAATTTLASVGPDGSPGFFATRGITLSDDGTKVLFSDNAASWTPECTSSGGTRVFLRDLVAQTTIRADLVTGANGCAESSWTRGSRAMSADGSMVVYTSLLAEPVSVGSPEAVYLTRL